MEQKNDTAEVSQFTNPYHLENVPMFRNTELSNK